MADKNRHLAIDAELRRQYVREQLVECLEADRTAWALTDEDVLAVLDDLMFIYAGGVVNVPRELQGLGAQWGEGGAS